MSNIIGMLARVFVDDLDAALPFYLHLSDEQDPLRFQFKDVQLAQVGPFLLISGNAQVYRDRQATVLVRDLKPVIAALNVAGGQVVEGPAAGPTGRRLIARHADGSVFEYIERA